MDTTTFGNFFGPDTLIIFLIILLLFGGKKLPELTRQIGDEARELRWPTNIDCVVLITALVIILTWFLFAASR